jgi:hypothetical protein
VRWVEGKESEKGGEERSFHRRGLSCTRAATGPGCVNGRESALLEEGLRKKRQQQIPVIVIEEKESSKKKEKNVARRGARCTLLKGMSGGVTRLGDSLCGLLQYTSRLRLL